MGVTLKPHRIYDLELPTDAAVIALPAVDYLGKSAIAFNTKTVYLAVTLPDTSNVWQPVTIMYDEETDGYCFTPTQDGQTQNVGRELYFDGVNQTGIAIDALEPRVVRSVQANVVNSKFSDMILADANNLPEGTFIGISTTAASIGGTFKFANWGQTKDINTSGFALNSILFINPANPGFMVDIQPSANAFPVARVDKVGAIDGILFVFASTARKIDSSLIPVGLSRFFVTADEETTTQGTFFLDKLNDPGIIASDTITVIAPDDDFGIGSQDILGPVQTGETSVDSGLYNGQIDVSIDISQSGEKLEWEIYKADDQGVPIDSGFLSEPVGTLGVRPAVRISSIDLNMPAGIIQRIPVSGFLTQDLTLLLGQRIRTRQLCYKIGAVGGDKTFTVYVGSDHLTYLDIPQTFTSTDIIDDSEFNSGKVTDALNALGIETTGTDIQVGGNFTRVLEEYAEFRFQIVGMHGICDSGQITLEYRINNMPIPGMDAININNVQTSAVPFDPNVDGIVEIGDKVTRVFTANAAGLDISTTEKIKRLSI